MNLKKSDKATIIVMVMLILFGLYGLFIGTQVTPLTTIIATAGWLLAFRDYLKAEGRLG